VVHYNTITDERFSNSYPRTHTVQYTIHKIQSTKAIKILYKQSYKKSKTSCHKVTELRSVLLTEGYSLHKLEHHKRQEIYSHTTVTFYSRHSTC